MYKNYISNRSWILFDSVITWFFLNEISNFKNMLISDLLFLIFVEGVTVDGTNCAEREKKCD